MKERKIKMLNEKKMLKTIYKLLKKDEKILQCHNMFGIQSANPNRCLVAGWCCGNYAVICKDGVTIKEWNRNRRAKEYALRFILEALENN